MPEVVIPVVWRGRHDKLDVLQAGVADTSHYTLESSVRVCSCSCAEHSRQQRTSKPAFPSRAWMYGWTAGLLAWKLFPQRESQWIVNRLKAAPYSWTEVSALVVNVLVEMLGPAALRSPVCVRVDLPPGLRIGSIVVCCYASKLGHRIYRQVSLLGLVY